MPRNLDGPVIRNANRGDSRESIPSKNPFSQRSSDSCESPQIFNSQCFSAPKRDSQKKGFQFWNLKIIRANLRIDSSESGHLSWTRRTQQMAKELGHFISVVRGSIPNASSLLVSSCCLSVRPLSMFGLCSCRSQPDNCRWHPSPMAMALQSL